MVVGVVGALLLWGGPSPEPEGEVSPAPRPVVTSTPDVPPSAEPAAPVAVAEPAPIAPEPGDEVPRELKKLLVGNPAPGEWVEDPPELYSEQVFGDQVEAMLVECDSAHRIVDVTCDEAPCMVAWVAAPDDPHPATCGRWAGAFGSGITKVGFDVDCPDGRRVRAELATPQEALLESVEDPDAWHGGRMAHRAAAYTVSNWCE